MAIELTPGFWVLDDPNGDTFNGSAQEVTGNAGPDNIRAKPVNIVSGLGGDDTIEATGATGVSGGSGDDRITVFDGALGVSITPGDGADVVRLASVQDTAAAPAILGGSDDDPVNSGDGSVDTFIIDAGALGSIPPLVDTIRDVSIRGIADDFSKIVTIYGFEPGDQLQIRGAAAGAAQVGQGIELYNPVTGQLNEPIGRGAFVAMGDVAVQVVSANSQQAFSGEADFDNRVQFEDESSSPVFQVAPGDDAGPDGPPDDGDSPANPDTGTDDPDTTAVYRFYNIETGTHFYTASETEKDFVASELDEFQFEGAAYRASAEPAEGTTPFFRFFNKETGTHFYTASEAERDTVRDTLDSFDFEGTAYHLNAQAEGNDVALHRFYNTDTNTHFYTASEAEKDHVMKRLDSFNYEGIAGYVEVA
ncbi:MAG: hypothetical protein GVY13_01430 [Alphaproteobacteria bacterium]|jgi:hypothetical protein|nr:hypothetical protein [Alphaproteobacteria bacterium]